MQSRPILFSGEMVRAILDGRKTQTRRVVSDKILAECHPHSLAFPSWCPYGQPDDRMWVRENFWCAEQDGFGVGTRRLFYSADQSGGPDLKHGHAWTGTPMAWGQHPSIHMPRWASRITLEIVRVRVERLQDISEADADAECFGGDFPGRVLPDLFPGDPEQWCHLTMRECYARLWNFINGPGSWDANPWVWVVEFKRVTP